jgi:hypothetical protein
MRAFSFLAFMTLLGVLLTADVFAQAKVDPLLKAGGFVYFYRGEYNGFSANVEFEKAFTRSHFLTSGPRIDYINYPGNDNSLMLAYDLKFYPFYWKNRRPYQGMFIGVDLVYFLKNSDTYSSRYGPGIGSLIGYQYLIKDKVSLSIEGNVIYMHDLSETAVQTNLRHNYFDEFLSVKVGFRL